MNDITRIILIGLRSSGKTSLGKAIAKELNWAFTDADLELVKREGREIAEIFKTDGESKFRELEKNIFKELSTKNKTVIATGGGVVLDPENIAAMRTPGSIVIYLTAPVEILVERMTEDPATKTQRPALTDLNEYKEMELMAKKRAPLYAGAAEIIIDTSSADIASLTNEAISKIKKANK